MTGLTGPMGRFWRRVVFRLRRDRLERELAEELEFHRSLKESNNSATGLGKEDAVRLTSRQMGNMTLAREASRDMWSFLTLERLWHDLRYATRMFRSNPGFTAVAALSLALGIGGNAAVFSLVNKLLIQPLPYSHPDRLVRITGVYPRAGYALFKDESRTMDVAQVSPGMEFNLTGQGEAVRLFGAPASPNLFSVLGASVERGRSFEPGEDRPGRDGVVVLSDSLWKTRLGGDPEIIGRVITLDNIDRTVVGVMPAGFAYPSSKVQFWIPARLDPSVLALYWGGEYRALIGRLRPGSTIGQARSEIPELVSKLNGMFPFPMPRNFNAGATAISLQDDVVGGVRNKLLVLLASVAIVLLIACANVASLLLSRATSRRKEMALRAALGAGRVRILRQLLTESVLLSAIGGVLGALLGVAALSVFKAVLPRELPGLTGATIDLPVLGIVTGLAVLTGLAFGIVPALSASRIDLADSLKTGSQRSAHKWARLRSWFIGAELALTVVLVIAAGLLAKTLYVLSNVNVGFQPEHILTIRITPNQSMCTDRVPCVAHYTELVRRARAIPGVSDAAIANTVPMDGRFGTAEIPVDVEGHPKAPDFPAPMFLASAISPDYLSMMRIPLLAGRGFSDADGESAAKVVLVDSATASRFWPGESAVGKHIKSVSETDWRTIVGVVGDVRQFNLTDTPAPDGLTGAVYMPYAQSIQSGDVLPATMNLLVKTSADTARIGSEIRRLAVEQNPTVPVSEVHTMESLVSDSIASRRSTMALFISFAAAAIILAAVGIYGLVSYSVSQRRYEIGVRMAIGATKSNVVGLILKQGLAVAAVGIGAGLAGAILLTRFMAGLLYGVRASDPLTFASVTALLLGVTVAASCIPAWRAARIDLTKSLRVE